MLEMILLSKLNIEHNQTISNIESRIGVKITMEPDITRLIIKKIKLVHSYESNLIRRLWFDVKYLKLLYIKNFSDYI